MPSQGSYLLAGICAAHALNSVTHVIVACFRELRDEDEDFLALSRSFGSSVTT